GVRVGASLQNEPCSSARKKMRFSARFVRFARLERYRCKRLLKALWLSFDLFRRPIGSRSYGSSHSCYVAQEEMPNAAELRRPNSMGKWNRINLPTLKTAGLTPQTRTIESMIRFCRVYCVEKDIFIEGTILGQPCCNVIWYSRML